MMDTDHDKIIRVEEKLGALSGVVYEIKDNHLAHLKLDMEKITAKLDSINSRLAMWSGGIVVAVWGLDKFLK